MTKTITRCTWPGDDPQYQAYHDDEWGVPEWDDQALFEKLTLDGFQAGLAWITILRKRDNFRKAFGGFDPQVIANYGKRDVNRLLKDAGIVRHRGKIEATIGNAQAFLEIQNQEGPFSDYLWGFVGGQPRQNRWKKMSQLPAQTPESQAMSKDLKARGFKFCGPTICYAFMQAVGMVNDHTTDCFRHAPLSKPPRSR